MSGPIADRIVLMPLTHEQRQSATRLILRYCPHDHRDMLDALGLS